MGRADGPTKATDDAIRRRIRRGWLSVDRVLIGSLVFSASAHAAFGVVAGNAEPPPRSSTATTLELYAAIDPSILVEEAEVELAGSWDYAPEPDAPELVEEPEPAPEPVLEPEPEPILEPEPEPTELAAVEPDPEPEPVADPAPSIPDTEPIAVTPDPSDTPDPDALIAEPAAEVATADPDSTSGDSEPSETRHGPTNPQTAATDPNGMIGGTATERVAPLTGDERRALERLRARFDRRLGARIDRSVRWPRHLLTADIEGVVVIGFRFDTDGNVVDVVLVESSGHDALDEAALEQIAGLRLPDWDPALAAIDERYREVPLHFDPTG